MASAAAAAHGARVGSALAEGGKISRQRKSDVSEKTLSLHRYGNNFFGRLAQSQAFTFTTLGVIMINALWIAVDTQWNHERERKEDGTLPLAPYSTVIEHVFCSFFTVELVVRFLAFRMKVYILKDKPFMFDGFLVLCMVLETWILPLIYFVTNGSDSSSNGGGQTVPGNLTVLRLSRLVRLTRMTRIMRSLPELMTLIRGMASAFKAVGSILVFLLLVMYVFAIVFTSQVAGRGDAGRRVQEEGICSEDWGEYSAKVMFGSMGTAMMTLFTNGVLLDNVAPALNAIREESIFLQYLFMLFLVMSALTLLNMLIGVLCEVINKAAREESDIGQVADFKHNLKAAFKLIDTSEDGLVTRTEWRSMCLVPQVRKAFIDLGFNELHLEERLVQMQETLFGSTEESGRFPSVARRFSIDPVEPSSYDTPDPDLTVLQSAVQDGQAADGHPPVVFSSESMSAKRSLFANAPESSLSFEQFVEKILQLRPDQPASALDVELLKEHVRIEEFDIMRHADMIEALLAAPLGLPEEATAASARSGAEGTSRAGSPQLPHTCLPTVPEVPQASGSDGAFVGGGEAGASRFGSHGAASSSAAHIPSARQSPEDADQKWLRQVPTELLFHHLKTRRPPQLLCTLEDI